MNRPQRNARKTPDDALFIYSNLSYFNSFLIDEKKTVKGDQYFPPTNNVILLKLTPTKNFYHFFFLLNKNQITGILKKLSDLFYIELLWVGKGS